MSQLFFIPKAVRIDSTGSPYGGAKANFYLTGTTTRTDSYQNNARTTAHANPVIADSGGQFPAIYLDPAISYRCVITTSADVQLDDVDPVVSGVTGSDVTITDAGGYFTGTDSEAIFAEIGAGYGALAETETVTAEWTFSGGMDLSGAVVNNPKLTDYRLTHSTVSSSGGTTTINLGTANSFQTTLTENATIAFSGVPATGQLVAIQIEIIQDGAGGAYTVTWPAAVTWVGGSAPTISTGNNAVDIVNLTTRDGGTTWRGFYSQAFA